jgi:hypothetical protein
MFRSFIASWPMTILIFGVILNIAVIVAMFWGLGRLMGAL